jgi:hypothetical protein
MAVNGLLPVTFHDSPINSSDCQKKFSLHLNVSNIADTNHNELTLKTYSL